MNIPVEKIRQIEGFQDYFVTTTGQVVSTKGKVPILLRPYPTNDGYLKFDLRQSGHRKRAYIHQEVLTAFVGPRPTPIHEVRHRDGNCLNNDLDNLEWATHSENVADKKSHGTDRPKKMTDRKVQIIRELKSAKGEINDAFPYELLSRLFGYTHRQIAEVAKGHTRKTVEPLRISDLGYWVIPLPVWKPRGY